MKEIEVRTGKVVKFGFPMTPSKWVGKPKTRKITRLLMTCGGGMGGSRWYEYVEHFQFESIDPDGVVIVDRIDGKNVWVNPKYIVQAEDFVLVEADYDTTNPNYGQGKMKVKFLVEEDAKLVRIDEYDRGVVK